MTTRNLTVACVQMAVTVGEPRENLSRFLNHLQSLSSGQAQVICLPEMWTTDFRVEDGALLARQTRECLESVRVQAQRLNAGVIGSALEQDPQKADRFYNSAQILGNDGAIVGLYRKMHLFRPLQEDTFFAAGDEAVVVKISGATLGVAICYDLRFPEQFRELARLGAEVIFVPSAWPLSRVEHWRTLLQARAIENQVFCVGVNRCGKSARGFDFAGHSMVVGPWGEILWEGTTDREGVFLQTLDLNEVARVRQKITVWQDRRPDLYATWWKL